MRGIANRFGYDITPRFEMEADPHVREILSRVGPYTMTSPERVFALVQATRYVVKYDIPGAFVECGVWRGGSMMAVALTLLHEGGPTRDLYLFDTFEGMTEPTGKDRDSMGTSASSILTKTPSKTGIWCYASLEDVTQALRATGYPSEKIHFVKGKVEDTIPCNDLSQIAVLRLDTDWYESTYHELTHLFPLLKTGGVLIIDDYGHWQGAREATDQYFQEHTESPILLNRIDYTGRIAVKTSTVSR
jgi:hypothetical protein